MPASGAARSSRRKLGRVVFVRHGESIWNVTDPKRRLVQRFTGWADVPLTERGRIQAAAAGRCLKMFGIRPNSVFTSLLRRSKDTFDIIHEQDKSNNYAQIVQSWRLNERHYGALVGLSKEEAGNKLGNERVMEWRRSWYAAPPPLSSQDVTEWRHALWAKPMTIISEPGKPKNTSLEKGIAMPETESLQDCANRAKIVWTNGIFPRVSHGETVLVVAHANTIRALIRHVDAETMSVESVRGIHIPSAVPLVYDFAPLDDSKVFRPAAKPTPLGMRGRYLINKELLQLNMTGKYALGTAEDDLETTEQLDQVVASSSEPQKFFDLVERGLQEVLDYMDNGNGKNEALVLTDGKGVIVHANQGWQRLSGFRIEHIRGRPSSFMQGPLTDMKKVGELNQKLTSGVPAHTKIINYREDGTPFVNSFTAIPVYNWLHGESVSCDLLDSTYSFLVPDFFIARLDAAVDSPDLAPLTHEEIQKRNAKLNYSTMQAGVHELGDHVSGGNSLLLKAHINPPAAAEIVLPEEELGGTYVDTAVS